jgi:hypothetical protein
MRFAARVEPPFSGKKQSASLSRQAAFSYQGWISTGRIGPINASSPVRRGVPVAVVLVKPSVEAHDRNYIGDILRRLECQYKIGRFSVDKARPEPTLAPVGRIG